MKHVLVSLSLVLSVSSVAFADQQLVDYCLQTGGEVVQQWTCPATGNIRTGEVCKQSNSLGQVMYFNGCSAPEGKYKTLFFRACIIHDLCYHHEPTTNNKSKLNCDDQFLANMKKICKTTGVLNFECGLVAQTFYAAVVKGGDAAFSCSKENVQYPTDMDQLPLPSPAPLVSF